MSKLKETLSKLAEDYKFAIQRQIAVEKLQASGKLRQSITKELTDSGFSITSDEVHAYLLTDKGYRGNKTSVDRTKIDRLREWARKKGFRKFETIKSTGMRRFAKVSNKDSYWNGIAYAIRKKQQEHGTIKRYGYKGSDILQTVYDLQKVKIESDISLAVREDIVNGIKADFKFENIKIQ